MGYLTLNQKISRKYLTLFKKYRTSVFSDDLSDNSFDIDEISKSIMRNSMHIASSVCSDIIFASMKVPWAENQL